MDDDLFSLTDEEVQEVLMNLANESVVTANNVTEMNNKVQELAVMLANFTSDDYDDNA
jgi:hypothetical protein